MPMPIIFMHNNKHLVGKCIKFNKWYNLICKSLDAL